jgi:hypothetical protein
MGDQMQTIQIAYDALLARVTAGEITKSDPVEVLVDIDAAWANSDRSAHLAGMLLDYARDQANGASESRPPRERARRQRLYGIVQQLYERIRLAPPARAMGA